MFKRTHLASAIVFALTSQSLYAQEANASDTQEEKSVEVIEVSGIRGSLNKALNVKRQNFQIVDAIVAEDIGKFPDNNLVEAMQRITGVQVTDRGAGEVSTVSIRGLTDVTTTVNGRNIFTSSGRSIALADIPASLLKQVDVYKTRSAKLIETGIAGQIDIKTQRPFDFDGAKAVIAARGIYQEQADKTDPNLSMLLSNRWELSGGAEFGALVNISYAETNYRDQSITAGAMFPFMTDNPADGFMPYQQIATTVNGSSVWQPGTEDGLPFASGSTLPVNGEDVEYLLSRDALFHSDFTGKRERPAANISLQFAPNAESDYFFEAFYNGYRNESFNSLMFHFVNNHNALDFRDDVVLFEGTNIIKERTIGNNAMFSSGDLSTGKTDGYLYALGGNWYPTDDLALHAELIYQKSKFESEFLAMRFNGTGYGIAVDFNDGGGVPGYTMLDNPDTEDIDESDLTDSRQWTVAELYDNGGYSEGDATTFKIDGDYQTDLGWIETVYFGARYDVRTAEEGVRGVDGYCGCSLDGFDEDLYTITRDFYDGRANIATEWAVADGHYLMANRASFRDLYEFPDAELALQKTFDVEEKTAAAYLQASYSTNIAGHALGGEIGLRYVKVDTDMHFIEEDTRIESDADASTNSLLPSFTVRYNITDDLMFRIAYGETLRRPAFSQLNSNITYVEDVTNIGYGTASGGNPNLKPTESKNYDVALEWYFADSSSFYVTWFKREIEGLIVDFRNRISYQAPDADEPYDYILSQPDNASNGKLDGVEVGLVYFPSNLPEWLDGIGIQASYTMLDSTQDIPVTDEVGNVTGYDTTPMFGVSDSSYSVVLAYEKEDWFSARLSYVWREDFLANYEAALFANPLGVYRKPEESMDFQFSYHVNDNLMVTFDATNLTDEYFQSYYEYPNTHNFGSAIYSRTFALGARYTF